MTVLGGLAVDWLGEVEVLDHDTRAEVEVVSDNLHKLIRGLGRGTVGFDEDGERLSNTNGVRKLNKGATSELSVDKGLGDPAGDVSGGAIDLGVILAGESTTTVSTPSTVGVDDDLTAGKTGVTLGSTDDEAARGLDVVDGAIIQKVGRDDLLDDLLLNFFPELVCGDIFTVLGRDDNSVYTERLDTTVVMSVLNSDLGLGVRADPWERAIKTTFLHGLVELVGELDGQGE